MDPVQAVKDFNAAMASHDRPAIAEAADALVGWLEKEGHVPVCTELGYRVSFSAHQLKSYFRDMRAVAEMV